MRESSASSSSVLFFVFISFDQMNRNHSQSCEESVAKQLESDCAAQLLQVWLSPVGL